MLKTCVLAFVNEDNLEIMRLAADAGVVVAVLFAICLAILLLGLGGLSIRLVWRIITAPIRWMFSGDGAKAKAKYEKKVLKDIRQTAKEEGIPFSKDVPKRKRGRPTNKMIQEAEALQAKFDRDRTDAEKYPGPKRKPIVKPLFHKALAIIVIGLLLGMVVFVVLLLEEYGAQSRIPGFVIDWVETIRW